MRNIKKSSIILLLIIVISIIMIGVNSIYSRTVDTKKSEIKTENVLNNEDTVIVKKEEVKMIDKVISIVCDINLKHPDIVVAQAIEESGHWTSPKFKNNNNMFGMKKASQRPTLAVDYDRGNYSIYEKWEHSIYDYALWQSAYARNLSREQYFAKLGRTYAGNPAYVSNLKNIIKRYNLREKCTS